jgi:iron complex outermembrane receptor protein
VRIISLLAFLLVVFSSSAFSQESFSYYILNQELKVLSATGEELSLSKVPRYTVVITEEEIERLGAKNLFELLDKLPDFYAWRSFFGLKAVGAFGIRQSYFSEKVQVFIDGIPLMDPSNGSSFSTNNNISLKGIKQVEITYGPMTSLYGFNASLAVINLVTYSPDELNFKADLELSSGGDKNYFFLKSFSNKDNSLKGTISFSYSESKTPHRGYEDPLGYRGVFSPYSKHFVYYLKLNHDSGFFFKSYGVNRDDRFPAAISGFFSNGDHTYTNREAFLNQLGFKGELGDWGIAASANFNNYFLERGYNLCPSNHYFCLYAPYGFYGVEKRGVRTPSFNLRLNRLTEAGKFFVGFDYSKVDLYQSRVSATFLPSSLTYVLSTVENALLTGTPISPQALISKIPNFPMRELPDSENLILKRSRNILSPYFQYFYSEGGSSFLFNLRWDRSSDAGSALSSSFSFMKEFSENLKLKLNGGRAVRVPSFEEMYVRNNPFLRGNPDLKVEKEDSLIPSFEYSSDTTYFSGFLYFFWLRDFIYKRRVSLLAKQWDNYPGVVRIRGFSFSLKRRFLTSYELSFALNRRLTLKGLAGEYLEYPRTKLVTGVRYVGDKQFVGLDLTAYSRTSSEVPGFYRIDLNWNYSLTKSLTLSFQVKNLTNRKYYYPNGVPGDERTLWLGLHYSY